MAIEFAKKNNTTIQSAFFRLQASFSSESQEIHTEFFPIVN